MEQGSIRGARCGSESDQVGTRCVVEESETTRLIQTDNKDYIGLGESLTCLHPQSYKIRQSGIGAVNSVICLNLII
jgi:hypothetical protein